MTEADISLVDWSRAQFALTAMYHWIFVPLTLGLAFIVAIMETIYVRTGNEEWKRLTKFWMTLFGINFAIGVATGIILEFEFGTNWSNYSWLVGDIFGAPLAVEGIMAFFLESTFIAVMFFGWNKVSKKFHLVSTWLVAIGSNLSALWILVANGWMQSPVGMRFNPDTARSEMENFWDVLFSPVAINKFLHTISSGYVVGSLFVVGISAWYILKGRHILFAKRSMIIAAIFGLISSIFIALTGDGSAYQVGKVQPMKLAAMEGLYEGEEGTDLVVFGIMNGGKQITPDKEKQKENDDYLFAIKIPKMLSLLTARDANAFVPGINDLLYGNEEYGIESTESKMAKGKIAIKALYDYKEAKKNGDLVAAEDYRKTLEENYSYFGYGFFETPEEAVPPINLTFYSFHIMVGLGFFFIGFLMLIIWLNLKNKIEKQKLILRLAVPTIFLGYLASMLGWIVAEVGRQPWAIQDILPVKMATSHISTSSVQITFWLFAALFTVLLIAEVSIMLRQIKIGPKEGGQ
ncbi:MAG: cytochrome ubiquinol oxidase subunit I [Bacteroidales bacterium]|nr:cytochrome ubiquinol oxidase subunit I [Bacteroidales bacterium]